jgi:polyhydroxybutyrate depolymerase
MKRLMTTALLLCGAMLATATETLAACGGQTARSGPASINVGSMMRSFVVQASSGVDGRTPAPVLFVFHPFGMNAQYMQSRVPGRIWPEAVIVYPEGLSRGEGPLAPSWQGRPGELGDRDVQFFDAMLAWLVEHHCIDPHRVFAMGYSNGAAFASVLACTRPTALAGVAIASGRPVCTPSGAKPVIIGHGTRDQTIGYDQALQAAQMWSTANGCSAPPKGASTTCAAASSCEAAPVTLCTYAGGHEYNPAFTRSFVEFLKR